jgi:hypothetical protein
MPHTATARDRASRWAHRCGGRRATSSRRRTRRPPRSRSAPTARPTSRGIPVFAFKGETLEEYWQLADRIFDWSAEGFDGPNLILDDGGDAASLVAKSRFDTLGALHAHGADGDDDGRAPAVRAGRRRKALFPRSTSTTR